MPLKEYNSCGIVCQSPTPSGASAEKGPGKHRFPPAVERAPEAVGRPPGAVEDAPPAVGRPPGAVKRAPEAVDRPPGAAEDAPPAVESVPAAVSRPPGAVEDASGEVGHPSGEVDRPPGVRHLPAGPLAARWRTDRRPGPGDRGRSRGRQKEVGRPGFWRTIPTTVLRS